MKTKMILGITAIATCFPLFISWVERPIASSIDLRATIKNDDEPPCVFMTIMGEQSSEGFADFKNSLNFELSVSKGERWLIQAQNKDGGWGSGSHAKQNEMNPHAVLSDPATTAMSAMALYRCGYTIESGKYKEPLQKSLRYLLNEVTRNQNSPFITNVRGTQIQRKLGENIDAILALQFFNQVLPTLQDPSLKADVQDAIQNCVYKIERSMDETGKVKGSGWAGVLQSSFANSGLETAAKNKEIKVDQKKLQKSRDYQKSNYNAANNEVNTKEGAGIVLYAVSSSVRGSAEESKEAQALLAKAKAEGKIDKNAVVNRQNLVKIGVSEEKANSYDVANKVYNSAKVKAMNEDVLSGFGNNGGEEFMSFLQTGESMVVNNDNEWKKWYDNIGGKMIKIQNNDGSWNGHHCITSPAFCTATCLLILTVENDILSLQK